MLDDDDRRLLRLMQADPALGVPALAELTGSTPARVGRRLDRLRAEGVLLGSRAVIDWRALGYSVAVSLRITLDKAVARAFDEFIAAARLVPEVIEIQTFLGRVDVRLSLIARDLPDYQRIYREAILPLPHIADIEALMTVATVKSDESLPL
ncbi:Lrp/AsnC family transcriptional regulator [Yoonia sp.]|uniref:Lrp/AsnC family transcriptional regulator n=1 Tax=Yoonia sp. TaxID=2212373 RepID=UPI002FDAE769